MMVTKDRRRILVVEDDHLTSALLTQLLEAHGFEVSVAASAQEGRALLDSFDPDAAILDVMLGDGPSGVTLSHLIAREYPGVAILFLTRFADPGTAGNTRVDIPADCAFLVKDQIMKAGYLVEALEAALQNRTEDHRNGLATNSPLRQLTPNQVDVLHMVAQGFTNAGIARRRGVSESAVESSMAHIFRILKLKRDGELSLRVQAVRAYITEAGMPEAP
ncbi:MAG: response regulator transcription factor [Actinobacteria bacterium]|nr:response regulator transcription factor [Actinomycetota bacterium]